ncbi:MAG: hypothetical protein WBA62_16165 [Xanthobacteraceae bacterium]
MSLGRTELIGRRDIKCKAERIGTGAAVIDRTQQSDRVATTLRRGIERRNENPICNDTRVCSDEADQLREMPRGIRHTHEVDDLALGSQRGKATLAVIERQHRRARGRTEVDTERTRDGGEADILGGAPGQIRFVQTGIGEKLAHNRRTTIGLCL